MDQNAPDDFHHHYPLLHTLLTCLQMDQAASAPPTPSPPHTPSTQTHAPSSSSTPCSQQSSPPQQHDPPNSLTTTQTKKKERYEKPRTMEGWKAVCASQSLNPQNRPPLFHKRKAQTPPQTDNPIQSPSTSTQSSKKPKKEKIGPSTQKDGAKPTKGGPKTQVSGDQTST